MSCILGYNSTQFGPGEDEKSVDIAVKSVKDNLMIYGQITDCAVNNQPVAGALVKAFKRVNGRLIGICHTFTGCNGYYMLQLPSVQPGETVVVMATCGCTTTTFTPGCNTNCCSDCQPQPCSPNPCECQPEPCYPNPCDCQPQPCYPNPCDCQLQPCPPNPCDCQPQPCYPNPCDCQPQPCPPNPCDCQPQPCYPNPCDCQPQPCPPNPCDCQPQPCYPNPCDYQPQPCPPNPCDCQPQPCYPNPCGCKSQFPPHTCGC